MDHLYVMCSAAAGPVKIGRSQDPEKRCAALQPGHPGSLEVIAVFPHQGHAESAVHNAFDEHRVGGSEWFRLGSDAVEKVRQVVARSAEKSAPPPTSLRMAELRAMHGKTQQECADALGVKQNTYSGMETGSQGFRRRDLVTLSWLYGMEPADAFPELRGTIVDGRSEAA